MEATEKTSNNNCLRQTQISKFLLANHRKEEKKSIKTKTVSTYVGQKKCII